MRFAQRVERAKKIRRKRNADLPAGSPMFYYCRACGAEMTMPEDHVEPAPKHCNDCIKEGRDK